MKDITIEVKEKRSKQALKKINKMLDNCKNKVHLNIIARYLYLYIRMFRESIKKHEIITLIKRVDFKSLNIKDYYGQNTIGHMQNSK